MPYSAVVFDMGDIFFDATKWRRAMTACLQQEGVAIDYQAFCRQWEAKLVDVYLGCRDYWDAFHEFIADFRLSQQAAERAGSISRRPKPPRSKSGPCSTAWPKRLPA